MTSLKQEVMQDLQSAGLAPMHRFGQNFMIDPHALHGMIEHAELQEQDRIVEIGPGTGLLTQRLMPQVAEVMAVEIDQGMHGLLRNKFSESPLQLVHADALERKNVLHESIRLFAEQPWKLVANLPYDVSIPIILNALALPCPPSLICVTVQKEAAQRLCAVPGTKLWGASAVVAQSAGEGRIVQQLPPATFYPRPKVDSVILTWRSTGTLATEFSKWARKIFAFRRKVLSRALRDAGVARDQALAIVAELDLADGQRVEELPVADLQRVFAAVQALE